MLSALGHGQRPVLWVQDRASRRENGRLYGAGLRGMRFEGAILRVEVGHPRDVLWAMEEGAATGDVSAVVGEIHGAPRVLDFTATQRLVLRAEASGVPVWLIRSGDPGTLERRARALAPARGAVGDPSVRPARAGRGALGGGAVPGAGARSGALGRAS